MGGLGKDKTEKGEEAGKSERHSVAIGLLEWAGGEGGFNLGRFGSADLDVRTGCFFSRMKLIL